MADPPTYPEAGGDTSDETGGTPRWVKVLGIIAVVLVLMFVILHLAFGGFGGHTQR
jgi:hypothetical protein